MKLIIIILTLVLSSYVIVYEANAKVHSNDSSVLVQRQQYIIFCVYEGYNNGVVRIMLSDGTRQGLPFKENLLSKISATYLGTSVKIVVDSGVVSSFERYVK